MSEVIKIYKTELNHVWENISKWEKMGKSAKDEKAHLKVKCHHMIDRLLIIKQNYKRLLSTQSDQRGRTLLYMASVVGNNKAVQHLISIGADVDQGINPTPLQRIIDTIKMFSWHALVLSLGLTIGIVHFPVIYAAVHPVITLFLMVEVIAIPCLAVSSLLSFFLGKSHATPLSEAAINGHSDVVEKLLRYGAKIDSELDYGYDSAIFKIICDYEAYSVIAEACRGSELRAYKYRTGRELREWPRREPISEDKESKDKESKDNDPKKPTEEGASILDTADVQVVQFRQNIQEGTPSKNARVQSS